MRAHLVDGDQGALLAPLALTAIAVLALAASTARRPTRGWLQRPYLPIEILVPLHREDEARALLAPGRP